MWVPKKSLLSLFYFSPMVILMMIDNFDVQVQIVLLLHHYCHLLMMIMRLELVVNHLKHSKKEKRKVKVSL